MIVPAMPRIPRGQQAGFVYHVINRGNGRATISHKPQDYFGLRLFQTFQKPALSLSKGSIAALRSKPCGGSKFKVQEFKVILRLVPTVPGVPIVQPLCSVQNVSGILETSKGSTNTSWGTRRH